MSVNEVQSSLLKYKKALAILVSLSILLCGLFLRMKQSHTAQVYIHYAGEEATKGLAADGTQLDPYEISNALVVKKALEQVGAPNMSLSKVRGRISVAPVYELAEEEKYASFVDNFSSYDKSEDKRPFPTYYQIKFQTDEGMEFARNFLNALVEQYSLYYAENHAYTSDVTLLDGEAVLAYDYYETVELLENKLSSVQSVLRGIASSDLDYRSPRTGWSVRDLAFAFENLKKTQFADVAQYVLDNGASKDAMRLTAALNTKADNAELESLRYGAKADTQNDLMQTYSQRNRDYLWEAGADEESNQVRVDIERDEGYEEYKTTYDQMMLYYVDYEAASRDLIIDQTGYKKDASAFSNSGVDSYVEQALKTVCDRYNELHEQTELVLEDYNTYKAGRYLNRLSGISVDKTMGETIYYAASVVLSFGMGVIVVLFLQMKKKQA